MAKEHKVYDQMFSFPNNPAFSATYSVPLKAKLQSLTDFCSEHGIPLNPHQEQKNELLKRKLEHNFYV